MLHTPTSALVSDCCQLEFVNMSKIHLRLAVFKTHAHQQSVLVVFYFSNPYPPLSVCIFPMHMLKTIYIYIMLSACSLKVHQLPSRYSYSRQNKLRSQQGEDNAMCVCVWVYMYIFYIYFFSFSDLQTVAWLQRVVLSNGSCPTQRTLTLTAPFCRIKGAIPHIWLQTRKQSDDWRPWY